MKRFWSLLIMGTVLTGDAHGAEKRSLYDFVVRSIEGLEVKLDQYRGQVLLIVNTASNCGFTGQYEDLQKIYEEYRDRGFQVLAFPSNDFGGQEPGSNEEIKAFCSSSFATTFPMFEKGPVTGTEKQPIFKFLTEEANSELDGEIKWNFEKFLVSRDGRLVNRFWSITNPAAGRVTSQIEELLDER